MRSLSSLDLRWSDINRYGHGWPVSPRLDLCELVVAPRVDGSLRSWTISAYSWQVVAKVLVCVTSTDKFPISRRLFATRNWLANMHTYTFGNVSGQLQDLKLVAQVTVEVDLQLGLPTQPLV